MKQKRPPTPQKTAETVNKEIAIPLYSQIKELIIRAIASGEFKAGARIASEAELAKKYGVSRITTKQALLELMQEGIVYRVPGKGTFVKSLPSQMEAGPVNGNVRSYEQAEAVACENGKIIPPVGTAGVGLILPYLNDFYEAGIVSGAERELRNLNYHLIFRKSDNSMAEENRAIETLRAEGIQGLIIFPIEGPYCSNALIKLKVDGFPFVLVDRFFRGIDTNYVVSDNFGGAYAAGKYLISLGHRHIGLVGYSPENVISINSRIRGFTQALADMGITLPAQRMELTLEREQVYNHQSGRADPEAVKSIQGYLKKNPDLTAIFAINDYTAICVLRAALQLGIEVPGELSIVGFDNNLLSANVEVPLTTVNQPKKEIGRNAARLLLRIIQNPAADTEKIILPAELVIRASTSAPASKT